MSEKEKTQVEQEPTQQGGWRFYPVTIVAPKWIMEQIIYPQLEADAYEGKGLYENITTTPLEDVSEDDFAMVEVYDCKASFTRYFDELKQFGVMARGNTDAFLSGTMKHLLLELLKDLALYVKEHTDTPAQTKNYILEKVKMLDKMPIWGLFLQILVLQGLCRWLESVTFNEGDKGFNEAQSFYDWLSDVLLEKETSFCFGFYGDKDKERLKPLCDYLCTTNVGKAVQQALFGNVEPTAEALNQPEGTYAPADEKNTLKTQKKELPPELDTPEARALLQKVIDAGYCDESLHWFSGIDQWKEVYVQLIGKGGQEQKERTKDRSILALACLAIKASFELDIKTLTQNGKKGVAWAVFEKAFTYDGQIPNTNRSKMKEVAQCYDRSNGILSFEDLPDNAPDIVKQGIEPLFTD